MEDLDQAEAAEKVGLREGVAYAPARYLPSGLALDPGVVSDNARASAYDATSSFYDRMLSVTSAGVKGVGARAVEGRERRQGARCAVGPGVRSSNDPGDSKSAVARPLAVRSVQTREHHGQLIA